MRIYKGNADLVFRGIIAPWYGVLASIIAAAVAILALQPGMPAGIPAALLVVGAFFMWPVVVRNRVELYKDRLEIVFGWGRTIIPYDHVTDVHRTRGGFGEATGHLCSTSLDGVFIEAPQDGDAVVSVLNNDIFIAELRRRVGLDDPTPADAPPRKM